MYAPLGEETLTIIIRWIQVKSNHRTQSLQPNNKLHLQLTSKVYPQKSWQEKQLRQSQNLQAWPDLAQLAEYFLPSHLWKKKKQTQK